MRNIDFAKGVLKGSMAGIICGWSAMALNRMTGAFPIESGLAFNLMTFASGGAIFGIVVGGLMTIAKDRLPFNTSLPKAVLLSTGLWLILQAGSQLLSITNPERFHVDWGQTLQGLLIAVILGVVLGFLWDKESNYT